MPHTRRSPGERLWSQAPRLRLLLGYLLGRALGRRVDLDDLIQEICLRTLAQQKRLPPPEASEAALYRTLVPIARRCVLDCARAQRARPRDAARQPLLRREWTQASVRESELHGRERGASTRIAATEVALGPQRSFANLPAEYRRVIGLRQFEGLGAASAARRMGCSEAAMHGLYRQALSAWEQSARA